MYYCYYSCVSSFLFLQDMTRGVYDENTRGLWSRLAWLLGQSDTVNASSAPLLTTHVAYSYCIWRRQACFCRRRSQQCSFRLRLRPLGPSDLNCAPSDRPSDRPRPHLAGPGWLAGWYVGGTAEARRRYGGGIMVNYHLEKGKLQMREISGSSALY